MFEAYITNTALYPMMGIEVGTTVHFPATTQEIQAALAKIGIDGKRYSEVFITSFDSDVLGLYDYLDEYENIDELNELGTIDIPEHIQNYFDYEAYGRDMRINEGGVFAPGGYVAAAPAGFKEYYHGTQDIPPEHRIFAYPEKAEPVHSILGALKRFQEAPPAPHKDKAGPSHEGR